MLLLGFGTICIYIRYTHTRTHTQSEQHAVLFAQIHNTVGTEKDYYIKPKSTQREREKKGRTADPKWSECKAKPRSCSSSDKQRGGAGLRRPGAATGEYLLSCMMTCLTSSSVHEHVLEIVLPYECVFLLLQPCKPPPLFPASLPLLRQT